MKTKKIFFISECLLNQNIRAYGVGNTNGSGAVKELLDLLLSNDIGITSVPCPEIPYEGLKRFACGKAAYNNPEYKKICSDLTQKLVDRYKMYLDDDYKVLGFICVNGSPSCAIDYCYCDKKGTEKCNQSGIFIEEIQKILNDNNLSLNFVGVRIKELPKILEKIKKLL